MISTAELNSLRTQVAQTFSASATVLRKVQTEDTSGGFADTYTILATYACSFGRYPVRPLERENQPRVFSISEWSFLFSVDADVRVTDRLAVGNRTFEVVDAGLGSADVARRAICLEII